MASDPEKALKAFLEAQEIYQREDLDDFPKAVRLWKKVIGILEDMEYDVRIPAFSDGTVSTQISGKYSRVVENLVVCYSYLAGTLYKMGKYKQALDYRITQLRAVKEIGDTEGLAYANFHVGNCYRKIAQSEKETEKQELAKKELKYRLKAVQLWKKLQLDEPLAKEYSLLADAYYALGCYKDAINCRNLSIPLLMELGDKEQLAFAYYSISILYTELGDTKSAIQYLDKEETVLEGSENLEMIANAYGRIAQILFENKQYGESAKYRLKELPVREALKQTDRLGHITSDIAHCYDKLAKAPGSLKESRDEKYLHLAVEYWLKSIQLLVEQGDTENLAYCYNYLAGNYYDLGMVGESIEYRLKEVPIWEELRGGKQSDRKQKKKYDMQLAHVLKFLAINYHSLYERGEAIKYANEAIPLFRKLGDKVALALLYALLGRAHLHLREFDEALKATKAAEKYAEEADSHHDLGPLYYIISIYYYKQKDYATALSYCEKARDIMEGWGKSLFIANAYNNLGNIHWRLSGDAGKYFRYKTKALKLFKEYAKTGSPKQKAEALGIIASETDFLGFTIYKMTKRGEFLKMDKDDLREGIDNIIGDSIRSAKEYVAEITKSGEPIAPALESYLESIAMFGKDPEQLKIFFRVSALVSYNLWFETVRYKKHLSRTDEKALKDFEFICKILLKEKYLVEKHYSKEFIGEIETTLDNLQEFRKLE